MNSVLNTSQALHFTTNDLPLRDRVPLWRELFATKVVGVDFQPQTDTPFEASGTVHILPGLCVVSPYHSTPARLHRTSRLIADGDDSVGIVINLGGALTVSQRDRTAELDDGDAVTVLHTEPAIAEHSRISYIPIVVPRVALDSLVADVESLAIRVIPAQNEALRLLIRYVQLLRRDRAVEMPALRQSVATHILDLVALAIGATRDGTAIASRRGLPAGRLYSIKKDIVRNLRRPDLSVSTVAERACVTPRYVQILFEAEGTTFSQYVLSHRLAWVHRALNDPRYAGRSIAELAYEVGFGDLSYFNRTFRRQYGASPSEVRGELH